MLKTPFGNIRMFMDKKEVEFNFSKIQNSKSFLKTETYSLKYEFKKEKVDKTSKHFLKCILETNFEYEVYVETGERLEAISFLGNMNLENEIQTWLAVSYVIG